MEGGGKDGICMPSFIISCLGKLRIQNLSNKCRW